MLRQVDILTIVEDDSQIFMKVFQNPSLTHSRMNLKIIN